MQWQSFLEVFNCKLRTTRVLSDIKARMKRENELMSYLLSDPEVRKLVFLWLENRHANREFKSLEKAKVLKNSGNKTFQVKDYSSSINFYTKSAICAPSGSEDLSLAIGNRSASLFYLGKYNECIRDIELAIKLDYPEKLRYKLYLRKVKCHLKLGERRLAREALLHVREMISRCSDIPDTKKRDIRKQIAQLSSIASRMDNDTEDAVDSTAYLRPEVAFGENPEFPSASAGIDRKFAPDKGRYVVTNRDIKKGQILFVEKPFAFVLLDHDKSNNLCEHCCHLYGDVPIPCRTCLDTLYCDIKCWEEGWSYHRWECPGSQMGLWQQIGIAHLALKVLLMCTITMDKMKFNEVQKLVTNFDHLPTDLVIYGITATMLTLYLSKYTDFFKVNNLRECLMLKFTDDSLNFPCDISTENGQQVYVSSLLLRYILQLVSNGHAITKLNVTVSDKEKVSTEQQDRVATAIYPSASMMNHSCDPNIINSFMDQYLIVKATRDIAAGEEVYNCYGPHFRRMSRAHRREVLENQYCFTCECEPCTIPELQYFMERFTAMKCPECSGAMYNAHIPHYLRCLDCEEIIRTDNYHTELKQAQEFFTAAQVYIEIEKEEEALDRLKQCLSIRRNILYKYHKDITATLDLIGKVYAIMGRWLDSISYLEHSIVAVGERFGLCSIELANELNKLTDICIRYLQEESNTATKWYKNTLKKTRRYLDRAEEIVNLHYGPWNDACGEISEKKEILSTLLKDFNI